MNNTLKGWLAVLAIIGFMACILILFQTPIPEASKDVLLVLIGALVGVVKDVFGFYFGSSEGSARKTELMAQPDVVLQDPAQAIKDETGFIRLSVLLSLFTLLLFTLAFMGCSTTGKQETPQSMATKSMLAMKETIVATAQAGSVLCQAGKLDRSTCNDMESFYTLAGPAYDLAADSLVTAIKVNDAKGWEKYNNAALALTLLYNDILKVGTTAGLIKTPGGVQ